VRHYADDIVAFDAVGRLQFTGVDTYRAHWQACLAMCDGPMTLDMRELEIVAGDDVGFARNVSRCGGTGADGVEHACWTRATVGFRRIDGRWRVVHEHRSVPFDPTSGRALLDLEP
jgi:ketosteroid isomerase-like protein